MGASTLFSCKQSDINETIITTEDNSCDSTPSDALGPYYIGDTDQINDINTAQMSGIKMLVTGGVYVDSTIKQKIENAKIEIWHADHQGTYHPQARGDTSDFEPEQINLRGTVVTNKNGLYAFNSIRPGLYNPRPRHIHFIISAPGYKRVVTQTYFKNDDSNSSERIEDNIDNCLIIDFSIDSDDLLTGNIDFFLQPEDAN